jgi:hypothetical protein
MWLYYTQKISCFLVEKLTKEGTIITLFIIEDRKLAPLKKPI